MLVNVVHGNVKIHAAVIWVGVNESRRVYSKSENSKSICQSVLHINALRQCNLINQMSLIWHIARESIYSVGFICDEVCA